MRLSIKRKTASAVGGSSASKRMEVVLSTLNARYSHASLGLRYLRANLAEFREQSVIAEFVIGQKTEDIVEQILALQPDVVGLGVYIWNAVESLQLVRQLKLVKPDLIVVLGGPEVSYEYEQQAIVQLADFLITGWGDVSFPELLRSLNTPNAAKPDKVHAGKQPPLAAIALPYNEFSDVDLAQRTLYVEASRGCPFKCEFCLSALDKTAWPFPLDGFLQALDTLYVRGARVFKFVDRTFNLKVDTSLKILQFFLERIESALAAGEAPPFLHFELVPDHLPEKLKEMIVKFPAGTLQFEIGIQSLNIEVQARISRKQNNETASENLRWLRHESGAHLHVDLIAGLPGEDLNSFARGFDQLVALNPHEIQFGILKRLRGTPIIRHTDEFKLRFNPDPPYNILATSELDFSTLQRMNRFAKYWDIFANSGYFPNSMPVLLGSEAFNAFMAFSDWLHAHDYKSFGLSLDRQLDALDRFLLQRDGSNAAVSADRERHQVMHKRQRQGKTHAHTPARQLRHLAG
jgi:radical SAM superfamily enzyme YgiQ (UPF0313 family)